MPFVRISLHEGNSDDYLEAVSQGIHRAMVDVLGITDDDRFHMVHEHRPGTLLQDATYAGIPRGPGSIMMQLWFTARPPAMKLRLFDAIVENLGRDPGVAPADIYINVNEPAPENWWIHGREVDPETGFDVRMADAAARLAAEG